jgi:hypothetical protein
LPATHASPSARQDNAKAQQTSATCGRISQQELPLVSPDLCSAKMSRDICPLGLKTYSTTWTDWVIATRQDYLARRKSAQLTEENGCSGSQNWPTATARDWKGCGNAVQRKDGKHRLDTLEAVALFGQPVQGNHSTDGKNPERWATPRANKTTGENPETWEKRNKAGKVATMPLGAQVKKWATPEAQNQTGYQTSHGQTFPRLGSQVKNWPTPASGTSSGGPHGLDGGSGARSMLPPEMKNSSGKLNPNWVEQLMGLDPGRTQLPTEWTG